MDPAEYRATYAAELERARARSATGGGGPADPAVPDLLAVLGDRSLPAIERQAALTELRRQSFVAIAFRRHRPNYLALLRDLVDTEASPLLDDALETLALERDEHAQQVLVDGLRDPDRAKVGPARALELLGQDVHADHYDVLEALADGAEDPVVRRLALRSLAADGDAVGLFQRIVSDPAEDTEARTISAVALQSLDREAFTSTAWDIVGDEGDDDEVRATCLTALGVDPVVSGAGGRGEQVQALRDATSTPSLAKAADRFIETSPPEDERA